MQPQMNDDLFLHIDASFKPPLEGIQKGLACLIFPIDIFTPIHVQVTW